MLTKLEIDQYWYKVQKYLINRNEVPIDTADPSTFANMLVQANGGRILGIAKHPLTCVSLCTFDKCLWVSFYTGNMSDIPKFKIDRNQCWKLKLNDTDDAWIENLQIYSMEELQTYVLDCQKIAALDFMHTRIEAYRSYILGKMLGQDFIQHAKYAESKEIIKNNVETDEELNYPFVTGYANVKNISLQDAAKQCLIQYEMQSGYLAESENIRIRYKNILQKETDVKNIKVIISDFETAHQKYGSSL
jgi:hypothetical protein